MSTKVLDGSPYSVPQESEAEVARLIKITGRLGADMRVATERARSQGLLDQVLRSQRYREVYESNALELEGPNLKDTVAALQSPLATNMTRTLAEGLLPELLAENPDLHAVVGLEAARLHATRMLASSRPIAESDIRSLHELITQGHDFAGQYKRFHVRLGGHTRHEPVLPIEVSSHMRSLVTWNDGCPPQNPILHAAALHAWLTHIHPFEDGNGRVARLMANISLAQTGLPPAIVKASTQRADYLDALAVSDEGGDIMPLAGLFSRALSRYVREMRRPRFFRQLFQDLVDSRTSSPYDWFVQQLEIFSTRLSAELSTQRLTIQRRDSIDVEAFEHYRHGWRRDPTTLLLIQSDAGAQLAMQITAPSPEVTRFTEIRDQWPSLRFAVRSGMYRLDPFTAVRAKHWGTCERSISIPRRRRRSPGSRKSSCTET